MVFFSFFLTIAQTALEPLVGWSSANCNEDVLKRPDDNYIKTPYTHLTTFLVDSFR